MSWNINIVGKPEDVRAAIEKDQNLPQQLKDGQHDNGRTYTRHNPFPALDLGGGAGWFGITRIKEVKRA